jgi:regulatory protein
VGISDVSIIAVAVCRSYFCLGTLEMAGEITAIKVQKRNKDRVNIYLDGEYAFSLKMIVAASLGRGDYLSDERIKELQMQDSFQKAYDRTLNYLAYRPRSSAEMSRYLRQKEVPSQVSEEVLLRLSAAGLLDDLAFARYWVENRETFKPRGRRLLRQELRQKGIDDGLIAEVLDEVDEGESAYQAASKQASRYAGLDDELFRQKMQNFLRRRGFTYEVITETISRLRRQRGSAGN